MDGWMGMGGWMDGWTEGFLSVMDPVPCLARLSSPSSVALFLCAQVQDAEAAQFRGGSIIPPVSCVECQLVLRSSAAR